MNKKEKNDSLREFNMENQLRIDYEKKFGASKSLVEVSRVIHFILQEGNSEIERLKDELLSYRRPIGSSVTNVREDAVKKRNAEVQQVVEKTYEEMECDDSTWNDTIRRVQNHILEELGFDAIEGGDEHGK